MIKRLGSITNPLRGMDQSPCYVGRAPKRFAEQIVDVILDGFERLTIFHQRLDGLGVVTVQVGVSAAYITHMFAMRCRENRIEHRFTKINHPWTDEHLERHIQDFVAAYNFGRRPKTLKGLTPFEFICKHWTSEPERFRLNPIHQMQALNNWGRWVLH
jgi:hypothetical protein